MFYTEYRPQKFADLIGADHIVLTITSALAKNKAPHSYFLTGGRGIGKTTTARLLAKALTCQNPQIVQDHPTVKFEPCGVCSSCQMIQNANHLDVIEMDAASNRGIDDIRSLKEGIGLAPTLGTRKIYIIDEVHMLSNDASNALLKTLEEPPEHAYFVLCTTNAEKVLDTIKSRCVQLVFRRPEIADLVAKITKIADDKKFKLDDQTAQKIAVLAKGAYREAETYLEQVINGNLSQQNMATSNDQNTLLTGHILKGETASALSLIQNILGNGGNIEMWGVQYIEYLRSMLFAKAGVKADFSALTKADLVLSKEFTIALLKNCLQKFTEAINNIRYSPVATLPLEIAVIELTMSQDTAPNANVPDKSNEPSMSKDSSNQATLATQSTQPKQASKKESREADVPDNSIADPSTINAKSTPVAVKTAPKSTHEFPYKKLLEILKEKNHSIYLLLNACKIHAFDGKDLEFLASYSFHKERVMSSKIRLIIEEVATELAGTKVVVRCNIDTKNPESVKLTDKNVVNVSKQPLEDVFQNVFGNGLEVLSSD